jgi:high frequency lysogenization protein
VSDLAEQTVALAGVAQAARMVDQLSKTGSYPMEFLESSINSLFVFDLERAEDIFGGLPGVRLGLQNLCAILANQGEKSHRDTVRYFFNILQLERHFAADENMRGVVRSRLEHASFRAEHFATHVGEVCHSVAGIYQDTFSRLPRRVTVTGSAEHLENQRNADIVRSLLLAGVRSAFLWRQLGGRRWTLPLRRQAMLKTAQSMSRNLGIV